MTHIGKEVALDAEIAALVYINARISQIAEMDRSFYAAHIPQILQFRSEASFDLLGQRNHWLRLGSG
jgi:hypothetical protein